MIEAENLRLGYGGTEVLSLPKLHIAQGEQQLILGPSGSGKTTLLHALAGLIPPRDGTLLVAGQDMGRLSESARDHFRGKHIGLVFQSFHLLPGLSVWQNLHLGSYLTSLKQDAARATMLLESLGIASLRNRLPSALSQGQAQRVALARALLHRPKILLADEPTSSLDDASCTAVVELLMRTAKEAGVTLVVSTHDARLKPHFSQMLSLQTAEKAAA